MFDGWHAESEIEEALGDVEVPFHHIGWDHYDCSLELHGVPAGYRLSEAVQKIIYDAGFAKVYVNHEDKWETHYTWARNKDFAPVPGWDVSYPHKRGDDESAILIRGPVPSWPKEWFASGKVKIVGTHETSEPPETKLLDNKWWGLCRSLLTFLRRNSNTKSSKTAS
jgi:hypothetical protein